MGAVASPLTFGSASAGAVASCGTGGSACCGADMGTCCRSQLQPGAEVAGAVGEFMDIPELEHPMQDPYDVAAGRHPQSLQEPAYGISQALQN